MTGTVIFIAGIPVRSRSEGRLMPRILWRYLSKLKSKASTIETPANRWQGYGDRNSTCDCFQAFGVENIRNTVQNSSRRCWKIKLNIWLALVLPSFSLKWLKAVREITKRGWKRVFSNQSTKYSIPVCIRMIHKETMLIPLSLIDVVSFFFDRIIDGAGGTDLIFNRYTVLSGEGSLSTPKKNH